ncbi:MAG: hypothetical protein AB1546_06160 [bacterium]
MNRLSQLAILSVCFLLFARVVAADTFTIDLSLGWNLICLPFQPASSDPLAVLGADGKQLFSYDEDKRTYTQATIIETGAGYWLYTDTEKLLDIEGTAATLGSQKFTLKAGWNLIGAPKLLPVCWNDLYITIDSEPLSGSAVIANEPWAYSPSSGEYESVDVLKPWLAYWIYAAGAAQLEMSLSTNSACTGDGDCPGDGTHCMNPCTADAECVTCADGLTWNGENCEAVCNSDTDCAGENAHCKNPGLATAECINCNTGQVWDSAAQQCVTPVCSGDGDCTAEGAQCKNPGQLDAECIVCAGGSIWDGADCAMPACFNHDGCAGDDNYCKDPGTLNAVCVLCESGQVWDSTAQQCVTPACSGDGDCTAEGAHCKNPGLLDAECVVCAGGSIWDGADCAMPACFDHDGCAGDDNYCKDPGTLNAVCVLCDSGQTWDSTTQQCVTPPACSKDDDCPTHTKCINPGQTDAKCLTPIYLTLFSHNETDSPRYDAYNSLEGYTSLRTGILQIAELAAKHNAVYVFQSDWRSLEAALDYESEPGVTDNTNGKNIIRYLSEDLGIEIDPHSHESDGYNYADVACLISKLGVTPTGIVGGFLYDPPASADWEKFHNPMQGTMYPECQWEAEALWGGGTYQHQGLDDPAFGIWRPQNEDNFNVDDPNSDLPNIGGGDEKDTGTLFMLLDDIESGAAPAGKLYTASLATFELSMANDSGYYDQLDQQLASIDPYVAQGRVIWVSFKEALDIWRTQFGEEGFRYAVATEVGACDDSSDNDSDGKTDCDDTDCVSDVACSGTTCGTMTCSEGTVCEPDINVCVPDCRIQGNTCPQSLPNCDSATGLCKAN